MSSDPGPGRRERERGHVIFGLLEFHTLTLPYYIIGSYHSANSSFVIAKNAVHYKIIEFV